MLDKEKTLEDLGHFKGEISPYKCDFCGGPMAYLALGQDVFGEGEYAEAVIALYIKCVDCGAGDIAGHYDKYLIPYFRTDKDREWQ